MKLPLTASQVMQELGINTTFLQSTPYGYRLYRPSDLEFKHHVSQELGDALISRGIVVAAGSVVNGLVRPGYCNYKYAPNCQAMFILMNVGD